MKLRTSSKKLVELVDWDKLVTETYKRPYSLQQQEGGMGRGTFELTVPCEADDYDRETIPEIVNGPIMGVKFSAWLARDPTLPLPNPDDQYSWSLTLWWERNFYPSISMVANDLHARGLLDAGEYLINIDW